MKCCNNEIKINQGKQDGKPMYYASCPTCGRKYKSEIKAEVENYFNNFGNDIPVIKFPSTPAEIISWGNKNLAMLESTCARFIDNPAKQRLISKNLNYIMNLRGKTWDDIWKTQEGQDSIEAAFYDSLYYGAILPDMGYVIPRGGIASFDPNIECFRFALTTGSNAPFTSIEITPIHEYDDPINIQEDGNFTLKLKRGIPRGEVIAVAVLATRTDNGKTIGEIYDTERLIEKAMTHSDSYKAYIKERNEFNAAKAEGELKKDANGHYVVKTIEYMKGGQKKSFDKKIYEIDITNPYEGADRPEMLRKAAGKSFFRPWFKIRDAMAASEDDETQEITSRVQAVDQSISGAMKQFQQEPACIAEPAEIKDAEIVDMRPKPEPEKVPDLADKSEEQEETKNNITDLFDED